ncbi:hypothetical protein LX36DRAFT_651903 [Colletotrichum falcatum]|nr:hypothetical protein LX36DRAFT_651903 [Colletotrichum falcatum]
MRYTFTLAALLTWGAYAAPQDPQAPVSTSVTTLTVTGPPVSVPTEPIPNNPDSLPAPVSTSPAPSDPSQSAPPSGGPHCVCGATYCGKVLVGFQGMWPGILARHRS